MLQRYRSDAAGILSQSVITGIRYCKGSGALERCRMCILIPVAVGKYVVSDGQLLWN